VVEDFGDAALECCAVEPGRQERPCFGDDDRPDVLLDEFLWFVFLELVLVGLNSEARISSIESRFDLP
jgi:hypothetical protein